MFSKLKLKLGFHQVELEPEARDITTVEYMLDYSDTKS